MGMTVDKSGHNELVYYLGNARRRRIKQAVEAEAEMAVNFVTSLTSRTKEGVRSGDGPRRMHPGNWADVTSNLVRAIGQETRMEQNRIIVEWGVIKRQGLSGVTIHDVIEYAERLDNLNGIKVLAGVNRVYNRRIINSAQKVLDQKIISK